MLVSFVLYLLENYCGADDWLHPTGPSPVTLQGLQSFGGDFGHGFSIGEIDFYAAIYGQFSR